MLAGSDDIANLFSEEISGWVRACGTLKKPLMQQTQNHNEGHVLWRSRKPRKSASRARNYLHMRIAIEQGKNYTAKAKAILIVPVFPPNYVRLVERSRAL